MEAEPESTETVLLDPPTILTSEGDGAYTTSPVTELATIYSRLVSKVPMLPPLVIAKFPATKFVTAIEGEETSVAFVPFPLLFGMNPPPVEIKPASVLLVEVMSLVKSCPVDKVKFVFPNPIARERLVFPSPVDSVKFVFPNPTARERLVFPSPVAKVKLVSKAPWFVAAETAMFVTCKSEPPEMLVEVKTFEDNAVTPMRLAAL